MNKKLKIVLIANTSSFFNSFMINHIKHLSKKYDLFICCNDTYKLKKYIPNNVSLKNINFRRGLNLFNDIISFYLVLIFFLKTKPNLSISFTPKIGFMVALVAFITRTPSRVHWYTGQIWVKRKGFSRVFYKFIDKLIFFLSHKVLIDSFSQKNFLIKKRIISIKNSIVIHKGSVGGVDTSKFKFNYQKRVKLRQDFSISSKTFVFLYLGRINKDKGIIELINAFKKIRKNNDVLLIFVGPIEDEDLTYQIKDKNKILYFNFTTSPQDWYSLADTLCIPSHREGFGTVVIEAASCGIPALCSNIYGLYDSITEHETGFLHEVGSINDIKKKMSYIIKNKNLVKNYGMLARKRVLKDFEQNLITKKLIKFINSNIG